MKCVHIVALVIFLVLVGLVLTIKPRDVQRLQAGFLQMLAPFLKTGSQLHRQITALGEGLQTLEQLEKDNKRLRVENTELRAINQTLSGFEEENRRLRKALSYRERSVFKLVPARIITRDSATWWNTVRINRGFEDGVEPDMPVVTDQGLVGKTTTVGRNISTVVLIADENLKVAARIEGTREQGILMGTRTSTNQTPELVVNFLSKSAEIKPGQKVYSSGVGPVYPAGLLLGEVKEFRQRELDGQAVVTPAIDLSTIEDVFVVLKES